MQTRYPNSQLRALAGHWIGKISSTNFLILGYLYWQASISPDGRVGQSIETIAKATNLAWRTVQEKLQELGAAGAIEILSSGKERMLLQIPKRYWDPPAALSNAETPPASIEELIFRLCGSRPSAEMLRIMREAAGDDDLRLQQCLDTFFHQEKRWTTIQLLFVAVQHELKPRGYFDSHWTAA